MGEGESCFYSQPHEWLVVKIHTDNTITLNHFFQSHCNTDYGVYILQYIRNSIRGNVIITIITLSQVIGKKNTKVLTEV